MVIEYLESGKIETKIPYKKEFDIISSRISKQDLDVMIEELNRLLDETDIQTSSWIPGENWVGTIWEPIYKACGDEIVAGKYFGQLVFATVMQRNETWITGKFEKDGKKIKGRTYFRASKTANCTI